MITYIKQAMKEAIDNSIQDITFFPHGEEYEVDLEKLVSNRSMTTFHQKMRMFYLII
ncbi:hypothetical protein [Streptococcus sp. HMSC072D03]|uniref:hypothetical protein n=1 Tax=Streptococcus sp. HMSC072D03 TaxID=1739381 RepID=UPI00210A00E9|nr:hypothetical protein [Streptococcus sp. HMSC072D03]